MLSQIQSYKIPGTVSSMDFNSTNQRIIVGGKQSIKMIQFNTQKQYWFDCTKTIMKHKNVSMTKVCISELAWNKIENSNSVAMGTTSGFVFVYDVQKSSAKTLYSVKGHDGNIKNIVWLPNSQSVFLSSSYQNEINIWDFRIKERNKKQQYPESIKIRDIKFNPHDSNILAIQCSSAIKIADFRMIDAKFVVREILSKHIKDNELQGCMMQWDPHEKFRLASGVSKEINILNWQGSSLKLDETLTHYSLIKSFKWLKTKKNFFGISGQNPQKNICFYDLSDKDRVSYMFAGHSKSIDCWMMNNDEKIIISASNAKEKKQSNTPNLKSSVGQIVAQYTDNFIDPNETRLQHPLSFDNNNGLVFSLTINNPEVQITDKNSRKHKYSFPTMYYQLQQTNGNKFTNLKEQIEYLHKNYVYQGRNDVISEKNSQIALDCQKRLCAQFWKIIFILAYPEENKQHTLESIYEEKIKADIAFVQNRIILNNKSQLKRQFTKFNINNLLQYMVDQNELQTAVVAAIILQNKIAELIDETFFEKIITPYIQILRKLQLYTLASETISMTKLGRFTSNTSYNTLYRITCGWCKQSVTKGDCKCSLLCVLCQERLSERMVIWCKYCGHGGHAKEYKEWFSKNRLCPHGCEHECFQPEDFQ